MYEHVIDYSVLFCPAHVARIDTDWAFDGWGINALYVM